MNKGLLKLKAIVARAKKIREAGGSSTSTVKVVKYKIMQKDAVKQAAKELRSKTTGSKTASNAKKAKKATGKKKAGQLKLKF